MANITRVIDRIKIQNYKICKDIDIIFNAEKNIFIGENGVGKTTVLDSIALVLSGSVSTIEKIGYHNMFNMEVINIFMAGNRKIEDLPVLRIELFVNAGIKNQSINGAHHSGNKKEINGLKLEIKPGDFSKELKNALINNNVFPFEYYSANFYTFAGNPYGKTNKYKDSIWYRYLNNSTYNTDTQLKKFINRKYDDSVDSLVKRDITNSFRSTYDIFTKELYSNKKLPENSKFAIGYNGSDCFKEALIMLKDQVSIYQLGLGEKLLLTATNEIETISKNEKPAVILIEEPENHLSYSNMNNLIFNIQSNTKNQMFISTHSNMISSRLDLKNVKFFSKNCIISFDDISEETAVFFKKAPNPNLLNFILSSKNILVEGDAEYILFEEFYIMVNSCTFQEDKVSILSCGGKTFKRYLEINQKLDNKIAVITDNDTDYKKNIIENYKDYNKYSNIKINSDLNNENRTFEVSLYNNNKIILENKLQTPSMSNGVQNFMLNNKTESAYRILNLLLSDSDFRSKFKIPDYINEAFEWIR